MKRCYINCAAGFANDGEDILLRSIPGLKSGILCKNYPDKHADMQGSVSFLAEVLLTTMALYCFRICSRLVVIR